MATTGLWPVKSRLKEVIAYADNPSKTTNPKYVDNDLLSVIKYITPIRKKLRRAKDIYEKSPRLFELVKIELNLEKEARENTKTKENSKGAR